MEEKRRFCRLNAQVKVKWRKLAEAVSSDLQSQARSKNISQGGICMVMDEKVVERGDRLFLEIELPGKGAVNTKARVVWVMKNIKSQPWEKEIVSYDVGLEFIDISSEDIKRLEDAFLVTEQRKSGKLYE